MNLAALEAFVKVMETASISLAADQLFITQPAKKLNVFIV